MIKKLTILFLALILILGLFIRIYKIDKTPPSLNWDETAAAYNAWSIFHWGKDEWGNRLPLVFTSFRDDKHPVHIYLTAPFVGIFGLNEFAARLPAAIISSFGIILMFFLAKKIFKSDIAGLFAALFLAISPYHLHYSRGLWEVDFALFFFLLGLTLFMYALENYKLLYFAYFAFGLSLYSYHSSKLVVLPMVLLLLILYLKKLLKFKVHFYLSFGIFLLFTLGMFLEPRLLGLARVRQNSFGKDLVQSTRSYKLTKNEQLGGFEIALKNYPSYFSFEYLFNKGDQNPRGSIKAPGIGEFYTIDSVLMLIGLLALLYLRSRITLVILAWTFLAPTPAALSSLTPNSTRALFMMGSLHLLAALGAFVILKFLNKRILQIGAAIAIISVIGIQFLGLMKYYFNDYSNSEANEWQYGMKEIVNYVVNNPNYYKVYMDSVRSQPYIFFLFYGKVPLPELLKTVKYEEGETKSYNTVKSFGKYQFGSWDFVNSYPSHNILYVVEPSKYSGLRYLGDFETLRVKFPSGSDAFFMVTGNK